MAPSSSAKSQKLPPRITSTAEFAAYVGLARTTVSRVLNRQPGLKRKTIERVERALAETGFTPNGFAKSLKGHRNATVGVFMENLATPTIVAKLAALQRLLRKRDHTSLIEVLQPGESRQVLQHFLSMRVDGVVFIGHFPTAELADRAAELQRRELPYVILDQTDVPDAETVACDRVKAMELAMAHLLDHGHTRFGLLGISGASKSIRDRLAGIDHSLRARQLDPASVTRSLDYLVTRETDFGFGRQLAARFASLPDRPTAYVALNDEIAAGAILEFQERGLRVPGDVSVVGFNNQEVCQISRPALSTIDQQIELTVQTAVQRLFEKIVNPAARPLQQWIEPIFVARGSSGPAPV